MYQIKFIIHSEQAMLDWGAKLAEIVEPGSIIYLQGVLGVGKTTLVRGFLHGLGYQGIVKSPTYTLVETYRYSQHTIHHFDLYRLSNPEELEYIGLRDYLTEEAICLIEWPEKAKQLLPDPVLCCKIICNPQDQSRQITVTTSDDQLAVIFSRNFQ